MLFAAAAVGAGVYWLWPPRVRTGTSQIGTSGSTAPSASAVSEYVAFASDLQLPPGAPAVTDTIEGLRRLAGALGELGIGDPSLPIDLRVSAEHLSLNQRSTANATRVCDLLRAVAAALPPGAGAERAAAAAAALDPMMPLPDQAAALETFFRAAADALR